MRQSANERNELRLSRAAQVGLALAAALLLLTDLAATDLWAPDEPRYGAVAEEMRSGVHGPAGWVLLHVAGEPYAQKPPGYFWLAALAGAPAGRVSEWTARLPSALAGLALVWLIARWGAALLGARTGLSGAALLLTAFLFAHLARRVQLDVVLALCECTALFAFWRLQSSAARARRDLALLHAALGAGVLVKGPVGWLVPVLVMATTLGWERRPGDLRRLFPAWGLVLSLGPGLVWIAAASALAPDGFATEAVGTNLFGRFFSGTSHARPIYYYLVQFPVDFLPWTPLLAVVAWLTPRTLRDGADPGRARAWRFLLAWLGSSLLFFSLSSGKRGLYLLPAFPAAALLSADAVWLALGGRPDFPRWVRATLGVLTGALALVGGLAGCVSASIPVSGMGGAALVGIAVAAAWAGQRAGRAREPALVRCGIGVAAVLAAELCVFTLVYPTLDGEKSPRPLARAAAAETRPGEPVGLVSKRTLRGGLAYYSGRRIVPLADADATRAFLASGGRVIVVPEKSLGELAGVARVEVRARVRSGRRAVVVVDARPVTAQPRRSPRSRPISARAGPSSMVRSGRASNAHTAKVAE